MRLFIAIPLSDCARDSLARLMNNLRADGAFGRWVRPENLHLTLRFLGEWPQSALPALTAALDAAVKGLGAFDLAYDAVGDFPSRDGHTLWVGAHECAPLMQLHAALERELVSEGFRRDARVFKPHLTLARAADSAVQNRMGELFRPFMARCEVLTLFSSQIGHGGPRYTVLHEARLARNG